MFLLFSPPCQIFTKSHSNLSSQQPVHLNKMQSSWLFRVLYPLLPANPFNGTPYQFIQEVFSQVAVTAQMVHIKQSQLSAALIHTAE